MSKVISLHHIVFGTKSRIPSIDANKCEELNRFIAKTIEEQKCHLLRVNNVPDHVHILFDLNPRVALADCVAKIKALSSGWMKRSGLYPLYMGWGDGYYGASISFNHRDPVIEYIKNQQIHHQNKGFEEEIQILHLKNGLTWHPLDLK